LILSFLKKHQVYLSANFNKHEKQAVSMITNGLLMDREFVQEYFSYDFTSAMFSLDTIDANLDHRELSQKQIQQILDNVDSVPEHAKKRVSARCTISRETATDMNAYIESIYKIGVRSVIIHPLILDSARGFIEWPEKEWEILRTTILTVMNKYQDLEISFSEGVGKKGENNCMIGSDMIAIDGSGDYSGCYFFTNQKAGPTNKMILGNIFTETIYIDRYQTFQKEFKQMFETEEQCKTCDYRDACYQCPAGNMDTGPKMFRPDSMCQQIVKLYLDLQTEVAKKQFVTSCNEFLNSISIGGMDFFKTKVLYLMYVYFAGKHPEESEDKNTPDVSIGEIFYLWSTIDRTSHNLDLSSFQNFVFSLPYDCSKSIEVAELFSKISGTPVASKDWTLEDRIGFFVLLQTFVYKHKIMKEAQKNELY
jgi:radical SAM protein with 4Fe4S-binding SPASM domain